MKSKKLIKLVIANYLHKSGITKRKILSKKNWPIVLNYHRITDHNDISNCICYPDNYITPESFSLQIKYLKENFKIIDINEIREYNALGKKFDSGTFYITFDDGWKDNLTNSCDIIKKYKINPIIFLAAKFINNEDLYWTHKFWILLQENTDVIENLFFQKIHFTTPETFHKLFGRINNLNINDRNTTISQICSQFDKLIGNKFNNLYLNWNDVNLLKLSNFTIGSHGYSHDPFTLFNYNESLDELKKSKKLIEQNTDTLLTDFSYPHSLYTASSLQALMKSSYSTAFGGERFFHNVFINNVLCLSRMSIEQDTISYYSNFYLPLFTSYLSGIF